jgi:small-conductance mechanosensitive channel
MRLSPAILILLQVIAASYPVHAADEPLQEPSSTRTPRAVMTGDQVVQILDETVNWYRTLGIQEQAATQPSDLLILYANRQTADRVMALAFEIARANAELLSSEAGVVRESSEAASARSLSRTQKQLDEQRARIQAEIDSSRRELAGAPKPRRADLQARISVLQGELDLIGARRNLLTNMQQFASQSDSDGFGANALKAHIDAIAASIPSSAGRAAAPIAAAAADKPDANAPGTAVGASLTQFGIWDLASTVLRLSAKTRTIETADERTADLQQVFTQIRTQPLEKLKSLAARGDELAAQADAAQTNLRVVRDEYDTLAWLFVQTSSIVTPLSKAEVLLNQYRHNLASWREAADRQYQEALRALGLRLAMVAGLLAIVFLLAEIWRRLVYRYVNEARRRSRLLLLRKILLWCLIVAIIASTLATELGSLATFAGLITAGLAVAMQSVLVSVVGYFFLIGKYGIRVGDRVQIGTVTGEVIELGLVRLHLMELGGAGPMSPTGRVVAFANSIIFQASGGLFKQIPGVNLAWREITLSLPAGANYEVIKDELTQSIGNIIADYREEIVRQARAIQKAAALNAASDPQPQVQLRFSAAGVEALVRYPVQLSHAAEIDERVSRELLSVISAHGGTPSATPALPG